MDKVTDRLAGLSPEKRELLESLLRKKRADAVSAASIPPRGATEGPLPLSFSQERLWLIDQFEPDSPMYNIPIGLRFTGNVQVAALVRSLNLIVRRHEGLRTRFEVQDGSPVQVIDPPGDFALPLVDLQALPQKARETEAARLVQQSALQPFDLRRGPLLRSTVVRLAAREHLLLSAMHHIVSDGWSSGVFARELGLLYAGFASGRPAALPPLPIQYADYALWQRRTIEGPVLEKQLEFWRRRLAGLDPVLELASDRPRPARRTPHGRLHRFTLPAPLSARIKDLAARQGTTLFPTLLAAFFTLLHRQTDREDLVIGTPTAGRRRVETEGLIGFFVNTLVVRADLTGDPPFREALTRVHEAVLDTQANQDVPFERLVSELVTERSLSYSPIFQVLFTFQNTPGGRLDLPGLAIEGLAPPQEAVKFDLSLTMTEEGPLLEGGFEYSLDLFEPATIDRLARQLRHLLEGGTADPEARLSALPLLDPAERRQILEEWAAGPAEVLAGPCLHGLFVAQAARTPDALALVHREQRLTYAQLAARAGGIAGRIAHRIGPLEPEARVAVCLERGPDLIATLLGALAAGGAYVPIDPAYPADRQALMLEDSAAAVLVTRGRLSAHLPAEARNGVRLLLDLDVDFDRGEIPEGTLPEGTATPDQLAYVIYTSGSTGRPKGVAIEHRSAVAMVGWARQEFSADELAGMLAATSVCFDLSVFEIFAPLAWGGTIFLAENALELPTLPAAAEVRLVNTVPSAATELVRSGGLPASVLTVNLAGEPLPAALAERLYATGTVQRVLNLYGPSEDTTYSTGVQVPRSADRPPAIGRPLPGTRAYVVDRRGEPMPAGVPGELRLAGAGLARGYLGRPELTAERFVPDPFGPPGSRAYRTGDLVRFRPPFGQDTELEFLGRIDHQVKVRGFRIELGEIESALRSHPAVRECVVIVREDTPGSRLLVAYLAGDPQIFPEIAELRALLAKRLPEYMVPSAFVVLEALPLTPNGKVDRKALPPPDRTDDDSYAAPTDPMEELIAGFWAEVLRLPRVGIHDNFFALGGHSLLATQVISRIRQVMEVELPQREIFEAPTVATLAAAVRAAREAGTVAAPPIVAAPRDAESSPAGRPLSFSQQRLWFLDRFEPGNPAYNIPLPVRLSGEIEVDLLERIFAEVVRRHEALRTTFASRDGQPVQVIAPAEDARPGLEILDLTGLPDTEREERVRAFATEEALRPFDLRQGPLLRLTLLRLASHDHVLLVTLHHIVSDGWSMGVLLREIATLHQAFSQGLPSPLPDLPVQYADFAAWQREWMQGEVLEAQLAYWKGQLAGAPAVLELPLDRPRPAVQTYGGAALDRTLPSSLSAALRELCRSQGVTPFMVLLAAWSALLGRHAGQPDVLVGTPIAGRNRREIEGLIGFFINSLVLRTDLTGEPDFAGLLARVRATALDAFSHQDIPFERIVEDLVPERNLAHSPLFQVMLVLQNAPRQDIDLPGLTLSPVELESRVAKLDLTLTFREDPDGFSGALEYNTDLFDTTTAARLLARFEVLLAAAVADPALAVGELPVLLPAERQQALFEWNDTQKAYPTALPGQTLHGLIAAQAAKTPDAVAAVFEGEALTYGDLVGRARQLARHLTASGVRPDSRVGVLLERSLEMIVGLLGVLEAGAAYVPLDSTYPAERLATLVESAGATVVLAQGRLTHLLPNRGETVVLLDELTSFPPLPAGESTMGTGEGLAYVIFTSGSTGTPKGVMVPHQGIVNRLLWMQEAYGLTPDDRVLQKTPFSFDVSVWELFWPLLTGARLVFARPEGHRDPAYLAGLIAREGITTLHFVPSMLQAFLEAPGFEPEALRSVRRVMASGEALPPDLVRRFFARFSDAELHNLYGPTEASVDVSFWPAVPEPPRSVVPIGRPIANLRLHVVDRELRPQPIGVPGELLLGGIGLARGYLGRPELTAAAFVPDAFGEEPGGRLYRTGDLTRLLPDGNVEYLGRIDHQVKIRGFRIELGEIEAVLAGHPSVRECVVLAREDNPGLRLLVAYLVGASPEAGLEIGALRTFLAQRLPDYMVPAAFVVLEALPLSPNGKVDRKALPAPDRARRERQGEIIAPRTPTEEILADIWKELLNLERLSVEDGFFELGGHSLLANQVLARVHQTFGVDLPLREVFKRPTIAGLGELIDEQVRAATSDDDLAALLDELDGLSDEETRARLEGLLPQEDE
jgi:amino acid adenylation domain-containing protein